MGAENTIDKQMQEELEWARDFVIDQARFCETCAEQENDPEQKKSDEESAEQFYALAQKIRDGATLDKYDLYDLLWIMHEAYHELELEAET